MKKNQFIFFVECVFQRLFHIGWSFIYMILWKIFYRKIGLGVFVSPMANVRWKSNVSLGDKVFINRWVCVWGEDVTLGYRSAIGPGSVIFGKVKIGSCVMVGPNGMIMGGNHGFNDLDIPMMDQPCTSNGIIIEDDVWIGAGSIILDGVRIGKGSVIGAGTIVTKEVPSYSIVVGNPGKIMKTRKDIRPNSHE
jgi:acetyltransferase-like isoleucine patch superfamily enzyme